MKRNDILRFIINNKHLYKFFMSFDWFRNLCMKRAKEILRKAESEEI